MRRRATRVTGSVEYRDGRVEELDRGRPDGRAGAGAPAARGGRDGTRGSDGARAGLRFPPAHDSFARLRDPLRRLGDRGCGRVRARVPGADLRARPARHRRRGRRRRRRRLGRRGAPAVGRARRLGGRAHARHRRRRRRGRAAPHHRAESRVRRAARARQGRDRRRLRGGGCPPRPGARARARARQGRIRLRAPGRGAPARRVTPRHLHRAGAPRRSGDGRAAGGGAEPRRRARRGLDERPRACAGAAQTARSRQVSNAPGAADRRGREAPRRGDRSASRCSATSSASSSPACAPS